MVMKLSRHYVLVFLVTLVIFLLGFSLAIFIDSIRFESLSTLNRFQEANYKSIQFQYNMLSSVELSEDQCNILATSIESSSRELSESLEDIEEYQELSSFNKDTFEAVYRIYLVDNLRYWLLAREATELCGFESLPVLYFFSDECERCSDQGVVLSYYKRIFGENLLVFPINVDYAGSEPAVQMIARYYNVTELPTIVVDEEVYPRLVPRDELEGIICSKLNCSEVSE